MQNYRARFAVAFMEEAAPRIHQTRGPFERMIRVYAALKERRYINCNTLARDLEVSPRSVGRDIEFMRDRLCLPIEYLPEEHTYVYGGAR